MTIELFFSPTATPEDREIAELYWHRSDDGWTEAVRDIALAYGLAVAAVSNRVTAACEAFSITENCVQCGGRRPFTSRADYDQRARKPKTTWAVTTPVSACERCRAAAADAARLQRAADAQARLAKAAHDKQRQWTILSSALAARRKDGVLIQDLLFSDALYLAAYLRVGATQDFSRLNPFPDLDPPLSPHQGFDREIVDRLYRRGALAIAPDSPADAFLFDDGDDDAFRYYPHKVSWVLPMAEGDVSTARFAELLEQRLTGGPLPPMWEAEIPKVVQRVALEECLAYLQLVMEEHRIDPSIGDKTRLVISAALRRFSIGQVFTFVWRAVKDAAAYQVRERISDRHAANLVPGSIQRMSESAVAQRWVVNAFRRDRRCPESAVSHLLFTGVLKASDAGMSTVFFPDDDEPPPEDDLG